VSLEESPRFGLGVGEEKCSGHDERR
jgi:hypothetical protein